MPENLNGQFGNEFIASASGQIFDQRVANEILSVIGGEMDHYPFRLGLYTYRLRRGDKTLEMRNQWDKPGGTRRSSIRYRYTPNDDPVPPDHNLTIPGITRVIVTLDTDGFLADYGLVIRGWLIRNDWKIADDTEINF